MKSTKASLLACLCLVACAAEPSPLETGEDGVSDDLDGKSDSGGITNGTPEACAVLRVANTASRAELDDDAGLAQRPAENIYAHRVGDDAQAATADDDHFDSIAELDAIPYVGPVAFGHLLAYATDLGYVADCTGSTPPDDDSNLPCVGVWVPGDYASLQTALTAVANAGQDATICIGATTLTTISTNGFIAADAGNHQKALRIIGVSRDQSRIANHLTVASGWGSVTIEHLTIDTPNQIGLSILHGPSTAVVRDTKLTGAFATTSSYLREMDVSIDRCDIGKQQQGNSVQIVSNEKSLTVRVTNSVLRGALWSQTWNHYQYNNLVKLHLINNTIVSPTYGIDLQDKIIATVANNIFTRAATHAMSWSNLATVTGRNNALWGNAANYAGYAIEGTGYVKTDCLLDASSVPGLRPGSPCRGAAYGPLVPDHDFYGASRGSPANIGAVEN